MDVRTICYSPLCDNNLAAYILYIAAVRSYGSSSYQYGRFDGKGSVARCDGGCADNGVSAVGSIRDICQGIAGVLAPCSGIEFSASDFSRIGYCSAEGTGSSVKTVVGDADDSVDHLGSSVRCRGVDESKDSACGGHSEDIDAAVELNSGVEAGCTGEKSGSQVSGCGVEKEKSGAGGVLRGINGGISYGRGVNYAKRCEERLRKKQRLRREKNINGSIGCVASGDVRGKNVRGDELEWRCVSGAVSGRSLSGFSRSGEKGRVWREEKKKEGFFSELPVGEQELLRDSRAKRLVAENRLQAYKAEQALELAKAKDLELMKQCQRTRYLRDSERNKVQIEKAYASLAATGNVPGVGGSTVADECSDSSRSGSGSGGAVGGTISPNSSVSMKEVHDMQKELETLRLVNEKYRARYGECDKPVASESYTADEDGNLPFFVYENTYNAGMLQKCADGRFRYALENSEDYSKW